MARRERDLVSEYGCGETRDLQHKLKARAMHINSNLDRRIKANDFQVHTTYNMDKSCKVVVSQK